MSGQLRALKNRIRSVESTRKITRAMEMVSTAKLKRYQSLMAQSAPYEAALQGILTRLMKTGRPLHHPLLEARPEKETALLVITSDTGLCGPYNHDLVTLTKKFLKESPQKPLLIGFGKNGINALSRSGFAWHQTFKDVKTSQIESVIQEINRSAQDLFHRQKIDALYVVHSHFESKTVARPKVERVLPFSLEVDPLSERAEDYILEPDPESLFARLVPLVMEAKLRKVFWESLVAEQMARMNAMHQATENATELIDALVLLRNKVRQAAITKELIEIVSGSKALKTG